MRVQKGLLGQYAGFFSRLLAFIIDIVILIVMFYAVTIVISSLMRLMGYNINECTTLTAAPRRQLIACSIGTISLLVINISLIPLYFILFWSLSGQTLGKAVMGLRVVRSNGRRMTLISAILRYLGYLLSLGAFGLGFAWILLDNRRQGWHDKIAGTCVIYSWEARMDERFLWRLVKAVQRRWGNPVVDHEEVIDVTSALRKYRIAVINLDQPAEVHQVIEVLKGIDREDDARVISVSIAQKDERNQITINDATETLPISQPLTFDHQNLDARMQMVVDSMRKNRSAVVAVIDQDYIDDVADALPQCEIAIYRVDLTPEYTRVDAPQEFAGVSAERPTGEEA